MLETMTFVWILAGAFGALLTGMLGTGSSLVILPVMVLTFPLVLETDPATAIRLAAGTTLVAMMVGAVSAAWSQSRRGNIDGQLLKQFVLPYLIGAISGPWLGRFFPHQVLKFYLAIILVIVAIRLLSARSARSGKLRVYDRRFEIQLVLVLVALASSVAGIASGLFTIPYLISRFSLDLRTAIGTSTAAAAWYSFVASIGYLTAGWGSDALPTGAWGYIYWPALVPTALSAFVFAPFGVNLAGIVNESLLRYGFAIFLLCCGLAILVLNP